MRLEKIIEKYVEDEKHFALENERLVAQLRAAANTCEKLQEELERAQEDRRKASLYEALVERVRSLEAELQNFPSYQEVIDAHFLQIFVLCFLCFYNISEPNQRVFSLSGLVSRQADALRQRALVAESNLERCESALMDERQHSSQLQDTLENLMSSLRGDQNAGNQNSVRELQATRELNAQLVKQCDDLREQRQSLQNEVFSVREEFARIREEYDCVLDRRVAERVQEMKAEVEAIVRPSLSFYAFSFCFFFSLLLLSFVCLSLRRSLFFLSFLEAGFHVLVFYSCRIYIISVLFFLLFLRYIP